jgi:hypothetical protein
MELYVTVPEYNGRRRPPTHKKPGAVSVILDYELVNPLAASISRSA